MWELPILDGLKWKDFQKSHEQLLISDSFPTGAGRTYFPANLY